MPRRPSALLLSCYVRVIVLFGSYAVQPSDVAWRGRRSMRSCVRGPRRRPRPRCSIELGGSCLRARWRVTGSSGRRCLSPAGDRRGLQGGRDRGGQPRPEPAADVAWKRLPRASPGSRPFLYGGVAGCRAADRQVLCDHRAEAQAAAQRLAGRIRPYGVHAEVVVRSGRVPAELEALAERAHADLLVVGATARGRSAGAVLGSVPRTLIERSRRPLTIVADHVPRGT